ncbi:MAG TPA: hypothetical protein ENF33_04305 [Nitrososphaeria archaeon]|nr:hypothetical protein [Nitrososphaeria archaeon]
MSSEAKLIKDEIDIDEIVKEIAAKNHESNAIVIYVGYVKRKVDGHNVNWLSCEPHEQYALKLLNNIIDEERMDEGISCIRIYHRVGRLKPGEPISYIFVSAKNRVKAFEKARKVLERVKRESMIFKMESRDDGDFLVLGDGRRLRIK